MSTERLSNARAAAREATRDAVEEAGDRIREGVELIKPKLRGWLHLCTIPVALAGGIVLVALSPDSRTRVGSAVFAVTALLLFAGSAALHRGRWTGGMGEVLRRLDHANIFLLIAGTYTPFTLLLLTGTTERVLLSVVWAGALIGIAFRVFWMGAPRWIYVPVYLALGWAAAFFLGDFAAAAGPAVLTLMIVGGLLYSLGGIVYGMRWPNPLPRYFGFHEVFHTFVVIAFITHYVGISIATYSLR